jgi:drug/metabolite transporter (DMT)-like permease
MLSKTRLFISDYYGCDIGNFWLLFQIFKVNMNSKKTGILAILGASIMWSLEPIFAKLAYADSDFLQTSAIRAIVVVLTALLYVLITGAGKLRISKNQFSTILYIAIAGTLIGDLLYFFALTKISVLNAVMIGHMQPVFIVLIGFFFLKEDRLTKFDYLGIFTMIVAGVFVTFYRYLIASVVFFVYLLVKSSLVVSNIYQILVGIIVGVGTILYYESMKRIKAAQVSAMELSTPFFAALLGFLILGEAVTVMQISGMVLLFVGVCLLSRKEEAYF